MSEELQQVASAHDHFGWTGFGDPTKLRTIAAELDRMHEIEEAAKSLVEAKRIGAVRGLPPYGLTECLIVLESALAGQEGG